MPGANSLRHPDTRYQIPHDSPTTTLVSGYLISGLVNGGDERTALVSGWYLAGEDGAIRVTGNAGSGDDPAFGCLAGAQPGLLARPAQGHGGDPCRSRVGEQLCGGYVAGVGSTLGSQPRDRFAERGGLGCRRPIETARRWTRD